MTFLWVRKLGRTHWGSSPDHEQSSGVTHWLHSADYLAVEKPRSQTCVWDLDPSAVTSPLLPFIRVRQEMVGTSPLPGIQASILWPPACIPDASQRLTLLADSPTLLGGVWECLLNPVPTLQPRGLVPLFPFCTCAGC